MRQFTPSEILSVMNKKGFVFFKDGSLNLIHIRAKGPVKNAFNDKQYLIRMKGEQLTMFVELDITTNPGRYYLLKPMNPSGTAIVAPGQYRGMWALGYHYRKNGTKYECLVQVGPCEVIRDNDRDEELDYDAAVRQIGIFDIQCHMSLEDGIAVQVDNWSAGCFVHANGPRYKKHLMPEVKKDISRFGNSFTNTLLLESEL